MKKSLIRRHLLAGLATAAILLASRADAASWNEGLDGDLSNVQGTPSMLLLGDGVNSVIGSVTGGSDQRDWLTVNVPSGYLLSSLTLTMYNSVDQTAFIGFQGGLAFVGDVNTPANHLGYTHLGPGQIGLNLLSQMAVAFGAQGFSVPLGAGNYAFLIQQIGAATSYQLNYNVSPVPEPGLLSLAAVAGGIFLMRRRRG